MMQVAKCQDELQRAHTPPVSLLPRLERMAWEGTTLATTIYRLSTRNLSADDAIDREPPIDTGTAISLGPVTGGGRGDHDERDSHLDLDLDDQPIRGNESAVAGTPNQEQVQWDADRFDDLECDQTSVSSSNDTFSFDEDEGVPARIYGPLPRLQRRNCVPWEEDFDDDDEELIHDPINKRRGGTESSYSYILTRAVECLVETTRLASESLVVVARSGSWTTTTTTTSASPGAPQSSCHDFQIAKHQQHQLSIWETVLPSQ